MNKKLIKILLIEDNPDHALLIQEMLDEIRDMKFELILANKLSEGLERLGEGDIDIVLSDLSLPDSHGMDTFIKISTHVKDIPIVVISAREDKMFAVNAVQMGAQDYLVKGQIDSNLLERSIHYAIERKRAEVIINKARAELEEKVKQRTADLEENCKKLQDEVAERKKYEKELYEQQNFLKTIISSTPDMLVLKDRNLVYQVVNKAFCEFLGKPKEEIIGKMDSDFFPKAEAETCHREELKVMETKNEQVVDIETDGKNGKKYFQIARTPVLDKRGNCTGILCTVRDITVCKEAEKSLKESEEKFRQIVEFSPMGIHMYSLESDNRLIFIGANPAADDILGIANKQFIGKTLEEAFPSLIHSEVPKRYRQACITGESWQTEQLDYEDKQIKGAFEVTAFQTSPGKMAAMFRDITKRKQAEEALLNYQKRLQSLASELSLTEERERRSIATDLHDYIGQSLALSRIKLKILQEKRTSPDLNQPLEEILKLTEQAITYTRSLMSELSPHVLYDLGFESAIEWLVEQTSNQHRISISFKNDQHSKPLNDEVRILLFKAVRELLINIVKHGQARNAKVSIQQAGDNIQIDVTDDGIGFDTSKTNPYEDKIGGFGLFNIRERLAYIGGRLEIRSEPGRGTNIILVAPLKRVEAVPYDYII